MEIGAGLMLSEGCCPPSSPVLLFIISTSSSLQRYCTVYQYCTVRKYLRTLYIFVPLLINNLSHSPIRRSEGCSFSTCTKASTYGGNRYSTRTVLSARVVRAFLVSFLPTFQLSIFFFPLHFLFLFDLFIFIYPFLFIRFSRSLASSSSSVLVSG